MPSVDWAPMRLSGVRVGGCCNINTLAVGTQSRWAKSISRSWLGRGILTVYAPLGCIKVEMLSVRNEFLEERSERGVCDDCQSSIKRAESVRLHEQRTLSVSNDSPPCFLI